MSDKKNELAIVGIFYDGYYDLWEDFLELFERNWGQCPYPVYIVNNEIELSYEKEYKVSVIHAGADAEYSRKVQVALEEIEAEYYLLLLDDFFLEKKIESNPLDEIVSIIKENDIKYYRMTLPEFTPNKKRNIIQQIKKDDEYTLSCQPSIWEKEFLKECIGTENYNAWIFEGMYCYSKSAHTDDFLKYCFDDYRNVLGLRHGALQGKLIPIVYNDFLNNGYYFKTKRKVISNEAYKKHILKQKIKQLLPNSIQKAIKKIFKTNSVVERYREEILDLMVRMGID